MMMGAQNVKFIGINEWHVETNHLTLSTTLGSCVSVCLWEPSRQIGGMNHFLLPHGTPGHPLEMGSALTDELLKAFIEKGALPQSMKAVVTGGSESVYDHYRIGQRNVEAALQTLKFYGVHQIQVASGGPFSRKLFFNVSQGELKIQKVHMDLKTSVKNELFSLK